MAGVFQDDPNGTNKNKHRNLPSWYFFDIWTPRSLPTQDLKKLKPIQEGEYLMYSCKSRLAFFKWNYFEKHSQMMEWWMLFCFALSCFHKVLAGCLFFTAPFETTGPHQLGINWTMLRSATMPWRSWIGYWKRWPSPFKEVMIEICAMRIFGVEECLVNQKHGLFGLWFPGRHCKYRDVCNLEASSRMEHSSLAHLETRKFPEESWCIDSWSYCKQLRIKHWWILGIYQLLLDVVTPQA